MRRVGIVGCEEAKFTSSTKDQAQRWIRALLMGADECVSGECHLGGIDIWAHEIADEMGVPFKGFPPLTKSWETGYKPRNLLIAGRSTECHCITVAKLPATYTSPWRFERCYHCDADHVKSGGCWTVKQARKLGRTGSVIVV
jgi:hypothetical protein